jgi:hypothetical protein
MAGKSGAAKRHTKNARFIQRSIESETGTRPKYRWCLYVVEKHLLVARERARADQRSVNEHLLELARDEIEAKKLRQAEG